MRRRYLPGETYEVVIGSGLDSERIGKVVDSRGKSQQFFKEIEPGRYWNFDPKNEVLLKDDKGFFTMFKSRLRVPPTVKQ